AVTRATCIYLTDDTTRSEYDTLPLHDALPICGQVVVDHRPFPRLGHRLHDVRPDVPGATGDQPGHVRPSPRRWPVLVRACACARVYAARPSGVRPAAGADLSEPGAAAARGRPRRDRVPRPRPAAPGSPSGSRTAAPAARRAGRSGPRGAAAGRGRRP